jgi:predicted TPR repeat methyltransferase
MLDRIVRLFGSPGNSARLADEANELGERLLDEENYEGALRAFREALAVMPGHAQANLNAAFAAQELGRDAEAETLLDSALAAAPTSPDANYLKGRLIAARGLPKEAEAFFRRALDARREFEHAHRDLFYSLVGRGLHSEARDAITAAIRACPQNAEFHFCLGNLHTEAGETAEAIACYSAALENAPGSVPALINLGNALLKTGESQRAEKCFREVTALLTPSPPEALLGLGRSLERQGKTNAAADCFRTLIEIAPDSVAAWQDLGNLYVARGETGSARDCFRQVLRIDPKHPVAHLVAAFAGDSTDTAPPEYVRQLFDEYADRFDTHLVNGLAYRTPEKLVRLLREAASGSPESRVLDLGCGTGLFGEALAIRPQLLVGVDLSARMLEKATSRGIYDRLEESELLTAMKNEASAEFDLIAAADVFVYVGRLDEIVCEAARILKPGGQFAFSVESLEARMESQPKGDSDFALTPTGRYVHSRKYLERLAARWGFKLLQSEETTIREDKGTAIVGYLVVWELVGCGQPE